MRWLAQTPFRVLTGHFARRLFASDEEQGSGGGIGLGLGAVLALLASPGAFASILLLDKYSTLLQWFRGQKNFDPYRASIPDEYFFVVLSMTITGLVMVLRWNRLLPDRRDYANLAALPIPTRNIFLANFVALLGLAFLFAIDVNAVSSFLFPVFLTMKDGTTPMFLRFASSHAVTVLAASLFSFFSVFAFVGVLMALLPRNWFGPVSLAARILLTVTLIAGLFSNLFVQFFTGRLPKEGGTYLEALPSFWFLGIYERMAGLASPFMLRLGDRAVTSLSAAVLIAILAYSVCYRRHFARLAEASSDRITLSPRPLRLHIPEWLARLVFRSPFERAFCGFLTCVLLRSERHLMFLGGYIGVGLVMLAGTAVSGAASVVSGRLPPADILGLPLMMTFILLTGLRFVCDMPAAIEANWMFRSTLQEPRPSTQAVMRRLLLFLVLPWQTIVCGPLTAHWFGSRVAVQHAIFTGSITVWLIWLLTVRFQKVPFTCVQELDIRRLLIRMLSCFTAVATILPAMSHIEHWVLGAPSRWIFVLVLEGAAWFWLRRYASGLAPEDTALIFEDRPRAQFELLKIA